MKYLDIVLTMYKDKYILPRNKLIVTQIEGNLFNAPSNSLLIHACNCIGHWSAGIASEFRQRYPNAHDEYKQYCKESDSDTIIGTSLLIHPDFSYIDNMHFIGCIFTSANYGRYRDSPEDILKATNTAMIDILEKVTAYNISCRKEGREVEEIVEIYMPKINSGMFKVEWNRTLSILNSIDTTDYDITSINVIIPNMSR